VAVAAYQSFQEIMIYLFLCFARRFIHKPAGRQAIREARTEMLGLQQQDS
jgi:hypothetical protein